MKDSLNKYMLYIIIVGLIIGLLYQCSSKKSEVKNLHTTYRFKEAMYKNNEKTLEREVDEKGRTITTQQQLIVTKDLEKEMLLLENDRLKRVTSEVKVNTITKIDSVFIPFQKDSTGRIPNNKVIRVNNE